MSYWIDARIDTLIDPCECPAVSIHAEELRWNSTPCSVEVRLWIKLVPSAAPILAKGDVRGTKEVLKAAAHSSLAHVDLGDPPVLWKNRVPSEMINGVVDGKPVILLVHLTEPCPTKAAERHRKCHPQLCQRCIGDKNVR